MLKNKKVFIILMTFIILFVFSVNVFASFDVDHKNDTITFPNLPNDMPTNHYILRKDDYWKAYGLWVANSWTEDSSFYRTGENDKYIGCGDGNYTLYRCYVDDMTKWVKINENERLIDTGSDFSSIVITTNDILNRDGTVFFQKTPETTVQETTLAKITRESHPEEVLIQILKIIPLILVVVVSFLGFRKAWRLLSQILHQA